MFGDPVINEKAWKINTFGDISNVRQGLQIPVSKRISTFEDGCHEYITVAYINNNKKREYIKNPKNTVVCNKNDILMTRTGNTGLVITDVEGVFHNNFFLVDFDRTKYHRVFLYYYLNLDYIQRDIVKRAGTSTIPDLNHKDFYKIIIYEPPIERQNQFANFVEVVDKSKFEVQKSIDKLELLKSSLIQQYFG
ncbi:MAG: type I restriction endonuclease [Clostridiales bacterium]|nr:type I restriction endonuclease [Clostridiales bacterium]